MSLTVDDEYYISVVDIYKLQIRELEQKLDSFKSTCDDLFANNNFGDYLQEVMQEIYLNFYDLTSGELNILINEASSITEEYLNDISANDKL